MTFGKPKLSGKPVRCLECGEQYPEHQVKLKHAGRTVGGDYWNSECPECGVTDVMLEEYAEMADEEFREEQHKKARNLLIIRNR